MHVRVNAHDPRRNATVTLDTVSVVLRRSCHHAFAWPLPEVWVKPLMLPTMRATCGPNCEAWVDDCVAVPPVTARFAWHDRVPHRLGHDTHTPAALRYCRAEHAVHCRVLDTYPATNRVQRESENRWLASNLFWCGVTNTHRIPRCQTPPCANSRPTHTFQLLPVWLDTSAAPIGILRPCMVSHTSKSADCACCTCHTP